LRYQTFIVFGDYAKKEWSNKKLGFSNSSISAGYDTKDDETLPIFSPLEQWQNDLTSY